MIAIAASTLNALHRAMPRTSALKLMPTETDDRDSRKTDPVHVAPDEPIDFKNPEFPPQAKLPDSDPRLTVATSLQDPNSWEHLQLRTIVEGMAELKTSREAFDADALLSKQTEVFAKIVNNGYEMVREAVISKLDAVVIKLDAVIPRVTKTEERLDSLDELRAEFGKMRSRMDQFETALARKADATQ